MFDTGLSMGSLVVYLKANAADLETNMKKAEALMRKTSKSLEAVGQKLVKNVTLPATIAGAAAVKSFASFDDAMTKSLAIMDGVTDGIKKDMESTARTLGREGVIPANELAKSYYYLASAGMNAQQSIKAMPVVQAFATAGAFDMARATDLLTDAQMAFGLSSKDAEKNMKGLVQVSDALALANKQSNASMEQFSEALTGGAATASKEFGLELKTTMAVLDAYAAKGIKAGEAGHMLQRALLLTKKSFADNASAFKRYGIDVVDEATGEYRNFIDVIGDMEDAFASMTGPQRTVALQMIGFDARLQQSILPLIGMTDAMKEWEREQDKAFGTNMQIYERQLKSFSAQMKILWNNVKDMGIEIGQVLAPVLQKFGEYVKKFTEWFRGLSDGQKRAIVMTTLFAAALGPVLIIMGKLVGSMGTLALMLSVSNKAGITFGLKSAAAGFKVLAKASLSFLATLLTHPIFLFIAGLTALGIALWKHRDTMVKVGGESMTIGDIMIATWEHVTTQLKVIWETITSNIGTALKFIMNVILFIPNKIIAVFDSLIKTVKNLVNVLMKSVYAITSISWDDWATHPLESYKKAKEGLKDLMDQESIKDVIVNDIKKAWGTDYIQEAFEAGKDTAKNFLDGFVEDLQFRSLEDMGGGIGDILRRAAEIRAEREAAMAAAAQKGAGGSLWPSIDSMSNVMGPMPWEGAPSFMGMGGGIETTPLEGMAAQLIELQDTLKNTTLGEFSEQMDGLIEQFIHLAGGGSKKGDMGLVEQTIESMRAMQESLEAAGFSDAADAMQPYIDQLEKARNEGNAFASAMTAAGEAAMTSFLDSARAVAAGEMTVKQAFKNMASAAIEASIQQAKVKAIEEAGMALASLAVGDLKGAALHGASALKFGLIAGAGSVAIGALQSSNSASSYGGTSTSATTRGSTSDTTTSSTTSKKTSSNVPNVTVVIENVHGSADEKFADDLSKRIADRIMDGRSYGTDF